MQADSKKYALVIDNDNFIVRDHRVHDVRVLPGVTFIDIIYRLLATRPAPGAFELTDMVFRQPVVTDESFDQRLFVEVQGGGERRRVVVRSQKVKNGVPLQDTLVENASCELVTHQSLPEPVLDIGSLKRQAVHVLDMDEVYAYARRVDIRHFTFMKTLGTVYQGASDVLMELSLSDLAASYLDKFHLHPALLDGATFAWVAARLKRYAFDPEPYIPLSIQKIRAVSPLTATCYVHVKLAPRALSEPQTEIAHADIKIYDANGRLAVAFDDLATKRVRSADAIRKLLVPGVSGGQFQPPQPAATPTLAVEADRGVAPVAGASAPVANAGGAAQLQQAIERDLRQQFAQIAAREPNDVPLDAAFFDIGFDSVRLLELVEKLEKKVGVKLYPTLLFEYNTIKELAAYFAAEHAAQYRVAEQAALTPQDPPRPTAPAADAVVAGKPRAVATTSEPAHAAGIEARPRQSSRQVAVVGIAGRYPASRDLASFWNAVVGRQDCTTEVPQERWDVSPYFDGKALQGNGTYSKWGGFIEGAEHFDAAFFSVSPREARSLDPQLRQLLQVAWHTLEDSGYVPQALRNRSVGVYVGSMNDDHTWRVAEHFSQTGQYESFGSYAHELANRLSYFLDFTGPSITVETACASSLTAIHMARQAILNGECEMALAGGVNLSLHPSKYIMLSQLGILSADGVERTFDARANGYVPGEGVGLVLLKSLQSAIEDGDHVYAVISGSAVSHSGRSAGRYVPSIKSLAQAMERAIDEADVQAERIGYIETHGTGTALGDPIELKAFANVFAKQTTRTQLCAVGSKANFGHLESASGICSLTKVLLSMAHRQIPPCANVESINPAMALDSSPFYVPTEPKRWQTQDGRLIAGINSFGVGGSNCFLVVENYAPAPMRAREAEPVEALVVVSARSSGQLLKLAKALAEHAEKRAQAADAAPEDLLDTAYTLQVGRLAMPERLAIVTDSMADLAARLREFLAREGASAEHGIYRGSARDETDAAITTRGAKRSVENWTRAGRLEAVAQCWVSGTAIDWSLLPRNRDRRRMSLPLYPFAEEIHRFPMPQQRQAAPPRDGAPETHVAAGAPAVRPAAPDNVLYLTPAWRRQQVVSSTEESAAPAVLLFDTDSALEQALQTSARPGTAVVLVLPGGEYRQTGEDSFEVRPQEREDYLRLIEHLKGKGMAPGWVIHRWCQGQGPFREEHEDIAAQLAGSFYSLLCLSQALLAQRSKETIRLQILHEPAQPLHAALGGFIRTLCAENPRFAAQSIELARSGAAGETRAADALARLLHAEYASSTVAAQRVRYEEGARWVEGLDEVGACARENAARGQSASGAVAIRHAGTYLISGGAGGLGLIIADHLVRSARANVVLLGRSPPDAATAARMQAIVARGGSLQYLQADVTDRPGLEQAVSRVVTQFGSINGVIHAAGVIRDSFIFQKEAASAAQVIAPKVYGTVNLDLATAQQPLDFFVMFSSLTSVLGNIGQADYGFANAFMDNFTATREALRERKQRSGATVAINWGLWDSGGMSIDSFMQKRWSEATGFEPLSAAGGIAGFETGLQLQLPQLIVAAGERGRVMGLLNMTVQTSDNREPATDTAGRSMPRLEEYLKRKIATVLELPATQLRERTSWSDYGLDSLLAIKVMRELEASFPALPRTLFFDNGNLQELAEFLRRQYPQVAAAVGAGEAEYGAGAQAVGGDTLAVSVTAGPDSEAFTPKVHPDMLGHEELSGESLLQLFRAGRIEKVDAACMACYPHDMLAAMTTRADAVFRALHTDGVEPLFLRVYSTHLGRIGQVLIPMTQEAILEKSARRRDVFVKGLELARDLGARTLAFQQTLPAATNYGRDVQEYIGDRTDLPAISTGHSVTIAAVVMMIESLVAQAGRHLSNETVGVLGMGSIGAATLRLMLMSQPHPRKLVLCDVYLRAEHVAEIARRMVEEFGYRGEVEIVLSRHGLDSRFYQSTVIIGATNVPDVLDIERVAPGTLIIDDSAPHCFDPDHAFARFSAAKDIVFTEGGLLRSPQAIRHLRYAPSSPRALHGGIAAQDLQVFGEYTYEQECHEILGCALAGLLNTRFAQEIAPTLGLVDGPTSLSAYRKLKELGFQGAGLRCRGVPLDTSIVAEFALRFGLSAPAQRHEAGRRAAY